MKSELIIIPICVQCTHVGMSGAGRPAGAGRAEGGAGAAPPGRDGSGGAGRPDPAPGGGGAPRWPSEPASKI